MTWPLWSWNANGLCCFKDRLCDRVSVMNLGDVRFDVDSNRKPSRFPVTFQYNERNRVVLAWVWIHYLFLVLSLSDHHEWRSHPSPFLIRFSCSSQTKFSIKKSETDLLHGTPRVLLRYNVLSQKFFQILFFSTFFLLKNGSDRWRIEVIESLSRVRETRTRYDCKR